MNTKKRIKILMTLAVVAIATLGMATVVNALTVTPIPFGADAYYHSYSWSGGPTKFDLQIAETLGPVTIAWTSNIDSDPNYIKTYEHDPVDPNIVNITLTKPAYAIYGGYYRVDFYAWVTDDNEEVKSSKMRIYVYDDACTAAKEYVKYTPSATVGWPLATDFNQDCITNFLDLVDLAAAWLEDFTPAGPFPAP